MIEYRSFRNDDPPRLADVWRAADLGPCGFQPMTAAWLESCVFSKPYFDREGLVVALDGERMVGFAHAGFGPNAEHTAISTATGTTMLVVVAAHDHQEEVGSALLARCEDYLLRRGAVTIMGGGTPDVGGFYLGLYGGATLPGILDSSPAMQGVFRRAGYLEADRIAVMRRPLAGFRPPVGRAQLAIRRSTQMRVIDEPARRDWWEAATTTGISLRRYELRDEAAAPLGSATFWDTARPRPGGRGAVRDPRLGSQRGGHQTVLQAGLRGHRARHGVSQGVTRRRLRDRFAATSPRPRAA